MRSRLRSQDSAGHRLLTRRLREALGLAGIEALEAEEVLEGFQFTGGSVEEVARGRTLLAWDVDYVDLRGFPLKDHQRVLVIRIPDVVPGETLVRRIVELVSAFRDQGTPKTIIVLERGAGKDRGDPAPGKPQSAAPAPSLHFAALPPKLPAPPRKP